MTKLARRPERERIRAQFAVDVAKFEMKVVRDDGEFRFVRFRAPESLSYHFDLITWPGHLCIVGDMGSYVFSRVRDMFTFFRLDKKNPEINPDYWGEKLLSSSKYHGFQEYSEELFTDAVTSDFEAYFEDREDSKEKAECWLEIESKVLRFASFEHDAYQAIASFQYQGFHFQDFFEHCLVDFTYQYIWSLYAIVWGIQKYDELHREQETA